MGNRIQELRPVYCKHIPHWDEMEEGVLYISREFEIANHLCACGCRGQTVTPFGERGWTLTDNQGKVSLTPSIGNFMGENPYHAHYYITENKIQWV
jgi:hypothetical protein